jgi:transcriptional regulator with XRE-family HTH domain
MFSMRHSEPAVKRTEGDKELTHDPRRLRRRRITAGLSIRELAAKAQVSVGSISMLENGKQSAGVKMLADLANALGCEIADLMPDENTA